jgi:hypothetical protein
MRGIRSVADAAACKEIGDDPGLSATHNAGTLARLATRQVFRGGRNALVARMRRLPRQRG